MHLRLVAAALALAWALSLRVWTHPSPSRDGESNCSFQRGEFSMAFSPFDILDGVTGFDLGLTLLDFAGTGAVTGFCLGMGDNGVIETSLAGCKGCANAYSPEAGA